MAHDLRLLVDAEHDGTLGRIKVEAYGIANLLDELRVLAQLERVDRWRLELKARQIRMMVHWLKPLCFDIFRVDQ